MLIGAHLGCFWCPNRGCQVLGKKSDPQTDELLAALSKENAATDTVEDELDDLEESFATTTQGHLPDDLLPEALEQVSKQLLKATLALEKGMVRLDTLAVTPGRQRDLRKNSVKKNIVRIYQKMVYLFSLLLCWQFLT